MIGSHRGPRPPAGRTLQSIRDALPQQLSGGRKRNGSIQHKWVIRQTTIQIFRLISAARKAIQHPTQWVQCQPVVNDLAHDPIRQVATLLENGRCDGTETCA